MKITRRGIRIVAILCLITSMGSCAVSCLVLSPDPITQSFIKGFQEGADLKPGDFEVFVNMANIFGYIMFVLSMMLFAAQFLVEKEKK